MKLVNALASEDTTKNEERRVCVLNAKSVMSSLIYAQLSSC